MKKILFATILLSLFCISNVFGTIIEKDYNFGDYQIQNIGNYQTIQFCDTKLAGNLGEPILPYHTVSLLLPPGEIAESIEICGNQKEILSKKFEIYPRQYSHPISNGRSGDFIKHTAIYNSKNLYPAKLHGELTTQFMNGYSFALCTFTPVEYLPASKEVSFFKNVTVKIHTKTAPNQNEILRNLNSSENILSKVKFIAQNPEQIINYPRNQMRNDDYELLIITPEQFQDEYEELIDLYLIRGIKTEIVATEYIYENIAGQDSQDKIRNYIIQEYQEHGIQYALLGGDVEFVPYRGFYCTVQSSSVYEDDNIPADLYYSGLDGNWNENNNNLWAEPGEADLLPEVAVARCTFSNQTELDNLLNKSISYQNSPVLGELDIPFLAGEHLWSNPETWGGDYLDLLIGYQDENGYTTTGIPEDDNYETLYDRDVGSWSASELISAINSGKSFVHHVGHAGTQYALRMSNSDITNSNFAQANGVDHNFTCVYTHGCMCGGFDTNDCIGERMINIENFAPAFVGNSRYGWFNEGQTEGPSEHLHREFINALYTEHAPRIGMTHLLSKIATAPWVTAPGQWEEGALRWCFYDCNVLGDPAMAIWTAEPIELEATYEDSIPIGQPILQITVSNPENSVQGLACTLMKDEIFHGAGIVDSFGLATIEIDPSINTVGEAEIIISGYNCLPISFPISIISNSGPMLTLVDYEVVDGNDNIPQYDENISLNLFIENVGMLEAFNVTATISSQDSFVTIQDSSCDVGNIPPQSVEELEEVFMIHIADNIPDQHQALFEIEFSENTEESWIYEIIITINAPDLISGNIFVDDSGGNSNTIIDPGETVLLTIPTFNIGNATSPFAVGNIFCSNEDITLGTPTFDLGEITAGDDALALFSATASENIPIGIYVDFTFTVDAGEYGFEQIYSLPIGIVRESFETGDFSFMDWEFGGNADWTISTDAYEGSYSAQSGDIDSNEMTAISLEIQVATNDIISFWKKVSTEANYDYFKFFIDENLQGEWAGEIDWSEEVFDISAGFHNLTWQYEKDGYVNSGEDCAWLDYITFPPLGEPYSSGNEPNMLQSKLFVNYPNPFYNFTTISFSSRMETENSEIEIYNIKGQCIRKFKIENVKCENNEVVWNGRNSDGKRVAPGLYFYKLRADDYQEVKKMILIR